MGMETGDVISEFKIENLDRPNKAIIYPFSLITLFLDILIIEEPKRIDLFINFQNFPYP